MLNKNFLDKEINFEKKLNIYLDLFYAMGSCLIKCNELFDEFEKFILKESYEDLELYFVS